MAAARGRPPARVTTAQASLGVAMSVGAAGALKLTVAAPAVSMALAHTCGRVTLAVRVARTGLTAVRAPVLVRTGGATLGPEESRFAPTEAWFHAHLIFPAGVWPLTDGDGAFSIFLPPAWTALELGKWAGALADILPLGVQIRFLGLLSPEQQQWEQQLQPHGGQCSGRAGVNLALTAPNPLPVSSQGFS